MSAEIVNLNTEKQRRGLFGGGGRHRRTPEAWAQMQQDLAAAKASEAQMRRERDDLAAKVERCESDVQKYKGDVHVLQTHMGQLQGELRQIRVLMGADPTNPANQVTHTASMPERPVDDSDPRDVVTQPINTTELFSDGPMEAMKPKVRVHDFPAPAPDAATRLITRIVPTGPATTENEKVRHVDETQVMPLWDIPQPDGRGGRRRTA